MTKIDEIVDSIVDSFTLPPGDTILPSGETLRDYVETRIEHMIYDIEKALAAT